MNNTYYILRPVLIFSYLSFLNIQGDSQITDLPWNLHTIDNTSFGADGTKLSDVDQDGDLDIVCGWEQGQVVRLYINSFPETRWPFIEVPSPDVEDALVVDLDQDGASDIISFSEGDHRRITVHWAPSRDQYLDSKAWTSLDIPATINVTQWMFGQVMEVDGKNGPDLIVGSKNDHALLGWLEAPADSRKMEEWKLHILAPAGWIMSIETVDLNDDGRNDILISDRYGENSGVKWFENPGWPAIRNQQKWTEHAVGLEGKHPMFLDVRKSSESNSWEIWVPEAEEGIFHFTQDKSRDLYWQEEKITFPDFSGTRGKSVCLGDINADGSIDLISTYERAENRSGVVCSYFHPKTNIWQHQDISGTAGIKYDFARLIDLDGDGDLDVLTSEENNNSDKNAGLGVIWYENPLINK